MAKIEKQPGHDHFGGEISLDTFYNHLDLADSINLRLIILPPIIETIHRTNIHAGVIAIGSTTDLNCEEYNDIDFIICAKNSAEAKKLRVELRKTLEKSDNIFIIEKLFLTDGTVEEVWARAVVSDVYLTGMVYEIVFPDSTYSWDDQLAHDRLNKLSFCQLVQP